MSVYGPGQPIKIVAANKSKNITKLIGDLIASDGNLDYAAFKLSLSGGEPKTAVILGEQGEFLAPSANFPSTHIIKASSHFTFIEAFGIALARDAQLFPVIDCSLQSVGQNPFLLIKRYDRIMKNGTVHKIAQEDFCQALGRDIEDKYGSLGGVEYADMAEIMLERLPEKDIRNFLKISFFSIFIGNSDDHAKNFAMINDERWRLAPAYDLVSGLTVRAMAQNNLMPEMFAHMDINQARRIGKTYSPDETDLDDWKELANVFQLDLSELEEIFQESAEGFEKALAIFPEQAENMIANIELSKENKTFAYNCAEFFENTCKERFEQMKNHMMNIFDESKSMVPKS